MGGIEVRRLLDGATTGGGGGGGDGRCLWLEVYRIGGGGEESDRASVL